MNQLQKIRKEAEYILTTLSSTAYLMRSMEIGDRLHYRFPNMDFTITLDVCTDTERQAHIAHITYRRYRIVPLMTVRVSRRNGQWFTAVPIAAEMRHHREVA